MIAIEEEEVEQPVPCVGIKSTQGIVDVVLAKDLTGGQETDIKDVLGYYRQFIPNYAEKALPLVELTKKKEPNMLRSEAPEVGLSASRTPLHHRPPVFRGKCQCRLLVKTPKSNGQPQHRRRRRNVRLLLNTRHPTTRESPAQFMLQRHVRTRLDLLKPSVADCVASAHYRQQWQHPGQERAFTAGDKVYARDYRSGHKWQPGTVAAQTGPVSFQVQVSPGRVWRRHQDQLLRAPSQDSGPSESRPDEAGGVSATAWTDSTPEDSAGDRYLPQASLPAPSEVPRPRSNTQDAETLMDADNSDGERRYPVRDRRKPRRLIEE
ncbi:uncharacterized protein LOC115330898 [Ixodes scapularis]|uniref:uncharacterized protein LOC115330898 n=1 Tax=Ixodes scapularis TaxID=6945 RepID=UPI001A9E5E45|nr:uncharacterized protein LOC115330898 [Ixodes scapularis]